MRYLARRFQQKQAVVRRRGKHTTASCFVHDRFVVETRIKAEKRKLESVLAVRLPVTTARVATEAAQERHNLGRKRDLPRLVQSGERYRNRRLIVTPADVNGCRAVGSWDHETRCAYLNNRRLAAGVPRLPRDVAARAGYLQLAAGKYVRERDRCRCDNQLLPKRRPMSYHQGHQRCRNPRNENRRTTFEHMLLRRVQIQMLGRF